LSLGVAVIGCGDMGRGHAAAWSARGDAKVLAVYDPDAERREQVASSTGATGYQELEAAIAHPGVDVVSVCTPVCYHAETSVLASRHGRHVLCEKPIALTIQDADSMISAAREARTLLSISFQYRGFSRNREVRRLVKMGAFGGPTFFRYVDIREVRPKLAMHRQSMNGGPVVDMASHWFDLVRYFTGEEFVSVKASGHVFGCGKSRLAGLPDLAIDAAAIEATTPSGHVLSAFVDWGMPEGFSELTDEMFVGPDLLARKDASGLELRRSGGATHAWMGDPDPSGPSVRIDGLVRSIRGEAPLEVTGEDGRAALRMSLAALESIRTGELVRLESDKFSLTLNDDHFLPDGVAEAKRL